MCLRTKGEEFLTLEHEQDRQADRQTDETKRITTAAFFDD